MNAHIGNPVRSGERELTLRSTQDSHTKKRSYWINVYIAGGDEVAAEVAEDGISEVCHAAADDLDEDIPF